MFVSEHSVVYFCACVCAVMDFSAAEKEVKYCVLLRLLSGMSFCHFGELWPRETYIQIAPGKKILRRGSVAVGIGRRMVGYASCLQTHLFYVNFCCFSFICKGWVTLYQFTRICVECNNGRISCINEVNANFAWFQPIFSDIWLSWQCALYLCNQTYRLWIDQPLKPSVITVAELHLQQF